MTHTEIGYLYAIGNGAVTVLTLVACVVALVVAMRLRTRSPGAWILAGSFALDLLCSIGLVVMNLAVAGVYEWRSIFEVVQFVTLLGEVLAGLGLVLGIALIAATKRAPAQTEVSHV
jgi:hypothetical protein